METRANYVLIGAFTLAGILAALGFFIWLANLQLDRQYAYYDITFDNVSGLNVASAVNFNGVSVGQVTQIHLYPKNPAKVLVRVQVDANTPIKADTTAQLKAQGVTGMSMVELAGGTPNAPLLRDTVDGVPVIEGQRSVVQALSEDAPNLLKEALKLMQDLRAFVGPGNQSYVTNILGNLDTASGKLQTALEDFSTITNTISQATGQITQFTGRLDSIGGTVQSTLDSAKGTLDVAKVTFTDAQTTLATATQTLSNAGTTFETANGVIRDQVPAIVASLTNTVIELEKAVAEFRSEGSTVITSFGDTSAVATQRLIQLEGILNGIDGTLGEAREALKAVTATSTSVRTLVDGEGTALVSDARGTLAKANISIDAINKVVTEDVPVVVADVRTATANVNTLIDQVSSDVTGLTGDFRPLIANADKTLTTATQTFADASVTLNRLDTAMDTAERTLAAAETTFTSANRVIDTEVGPTAADIRASAAKLSASVADVTADLPAITAELRKTLERANSAMAEIDRVVAASGPPIAQFTATGLPQFVSFTQEARNLVASLERLTARLDRDPARFFFGNTPPDFRR